ncbi:MAG: ArgE/DapE family deacylase [Actinomycetota bacterium]|nr:ArgE/DapE family deacylase [Actinomycetota bacterium]MDQ3429438.1 ArgE/DapE family deacylase [Actinomycetota bacterium]
MILPPGLEHRVCEHIARREGDLVELLRALVAFDTVTHSAGAAPREEAALQNFLGDRLAARGAAATVEEPDAALISGHPMVPPGFSFAGRPQLVARFAGAGGGRTLLLNGHVDVVVSGPRETWSSDPFDAVVRDGAVWGRGACDMKGGVACMVFAAEVLADLGVRLAGDLVVNTVTEEESTGAGGLFSARTLRADAAIVPEPSELAVLVACRGSLLPTITVEGKAGHAGLPLRDPERGGAVNAIEKAAYLVEAIRRLREEWTLRPRHTYLSPADCVPVGIDGGEWIVSYPARCRLDCHIEYLLDQADEHGGGSRVVREFEDWISRAAAADPWLREHPPRVEWPHSDVPPAEVSTEEPIVETLLGVERDLGRQGRIGGLDNWHDGATLILKAGIPTVCYGPGDIHRSHAADEHVPIADLVACAQGIALAALRFCGTA